MNTSKKMAKLIAKIFNAEYVHDDQMADFILGVIDNYDLEVYYGIEEEVVIVLDGYYVSIMKHFGAAAHKGIPKIFGHGVKLKLRRRDYLFFLRD